METLFEGVKKYKDKWLEMELYLFSFVLLLPSRDEEMNARVKEAFKNKLKGRSGIIIEGDKADWFVRLYELYEFRGNIIIGSFDKPFGRKLGNLVECGIADIETLIDDVILGAM